MIHNIISWVPFWEIVISQYKKVKEFLVVHDVYMAVEMKNLLSITYKTPNNPQDKKEFQEGNQLTIEGW